jgi:hypothetical protein
MAIDLKKMQERKFALDNRGGSQKNGFWKPQDGEQTIRIIPTADGDPFKDYWFHYNVGKNSGFMCPKKNYGEECPVCDFASQLWREDNEGSKKMAKSLFARQRFFSPVMVRGEEAQGVRVWGYGKMAYETLLNLVLNPEYGDITDTEAGTDLVMVYGKPPGGQFPLTKLTPKRSTTQFCEDVTPERCKELLDGIPDFEDLFERKTSGEVKALLDEFLLSDEDAESTSTETVKYASSTGASKSTEANSVSDAFDELLGS